MPGVLSKLVTIKTEIEFIETYCSDKASLLPDVVDFFSCGGHPVCPKHRTKYNKKAKRFAKYMPSKKAICCTHPDCSKEFTQRIHALQCCHADWEHFEMR
ncbi:MAG: hypothetical protein MHM6MM_003108 [Cercozoa sp. M6MM]